MEIIDVRHLGLAHAIGCWRVDDVLIDPGPESCHETLLAGLPHGFEPRAILLTHIHFDHAGAAGRLAQLWPRAEIYVHEVGAPHLIDPSRLVSSAKRLYQDEFDRMWGEVIPIPEERLRLLSGDEDVLGFHVARTLGHASHHVVYRHEESGTVFCGDMAAMRIPPSDYILPPTMPPEFDLEAWLDTIDLIEGWKPTALALTHFGLVETPGPHLAAARRQLASLSALGRNLDRETFAKRLRGEYVAHADPSTVEVYEDVGTPEMLWSGIERYWRKRSEAAA